MDYTDKKFILAGMAVALKLFSMAFCLLSGVFLRKKPAGKKKINIHFKLLLERHTPPFTPDLSPCLQPPACGMHTKLPRALYFHTAK